jgi:uncharacterized membrane protein
MQVIHGMVAAFCFYLVFGSFVLYWQRWRAGEAILPDGIEKQTFWLSVLMASIGVIFALQALGIMKLF